MGIKLFDRIQAKIELFRLEQRYTRRRNRRSTFVSNAIYVDGEYIYNSPNTTGSSSNTSRTQAHTPDDMPSSPVEAQPPVVSPEASKAQKRLNRWSSMPGFGSMSQPSGPAEPESQQQDWRSKRMSYAGGA